MFGNACTQLGAGIAAALCLQEQFTMTAGVVFSVSNSLLTSLRPAEALGLRNP